MGWGANNETSWVGNILGSGGSPSAFLSGILGRNLTGFDLFNATGPSMASGPLKLEKLSKLHPQTATRGVYVPLVLGRRQIGSEVLWVGDRRTKAQKAKKSGKGGGGSTGTTPRDYFESAWHALCIGPARAIYNIALVDKPVNPLQILRGSDYPAAASTTASGSFVSPPGVYVFWGEPNQPINGLGPAYGGLGASTRVGISSRWPQICYLVWKQRKLGTTPTWPSILLEVEVRTNSPLVDSTGWMDESDTGRGDTGVNAAHAIWDIWTSPWPRGIGRDYRELDYDRMEALGMLLQNEHLPINLIASDGASALATIGAIISDLGINWGQLGRQIVGFGIRPISDVDVPDLTNEVVSNLPEISMNIGDSLADRVETTFTNAKLKFTTDTVDASDDGLSLERARVNTNSQQLSFVTNREVAVKVHDIKQQIAFGINEAIDIELARVGRKISPGMGFLFDGIRYRVKSVQLDEKGRGAKVTAYLDSFDVDSSNPAAGNPDGGTDPGDPQVDQWFDFMELPRGLTNSDTPKIAMLRWRATEDTVSTLIHISSDGVSYTQIADVDTVQTGGILNEGIDINAPAIIEDGPTFDPTGVFDQEDIQDLSGDEASWRTGAQAAIINGEIFFLRNVTIIDATHVRLNGLMRARFDTQNETHAAGDRVVIVTDLDVLSSALFVPGATIWVKTQPSIAGSYVALGDVTPVAHVITGRAAAPLSAGFLKAKGAAGNAPLGTFEAGDDIAISWGYRVRDGGGNAAGESLAGDPMQVDGAGDLIVPAPDGPARLLICRNGEASGLLPPLAIIAASDGVYGTVEVSGDFSDITDEPGSIVQVRGGSGNMNGEAVIVTALYNSGPDTTTLTVAKQFVGSSATGEAILIVVYASLPLDEASVAIGNMTLSNTDLRAAHSDTEFPDYELRFIQQLATPGGVSIYESFPTIRQMKRT